MELCWEGKDHREYGDYSIYWSGGNTRELGTAFIVLGEMAKRVIGWWPVKDRMCRMRINGRFFNLSIINVHSPHIGSDADDKDREYRKCPKHDVKIVIGDLNAQVGQEEEFRPVIGRFSAHQQTNENGLRLIDFATSRNATSSHTQETRLLDVQSIPPKSQVPKFRTYPVEHFVSTRYDLDGTSTSQRKSLVCLL
ncbi:uncharacterized protein LOC128092353 [Culex pipiens pallens]|uniref:uncharacterized protein LOC128092353 n=1 Tax=Culex pipiens pallens TaxID=42434 RepID=UPI0022AB3A22|nr:uncharacterized protein LOC128092353 [Culex pipiens pallens]